MNMNKYEQFKHHHDVHHDDDSDVDYRVQGIAVVYTVVRVLQGTAERVLSSRSRHLSEQRSRHVHQRTVWKWNS